MSRRVQVPEPTIAHLRRWYDEPTVRNTKFVRGSLFGAIFGNSGQKAVTINRTVHLTRRADSPDTPGGIALFSHELYHVQQQEQMGWWLFLFRYVRHWHPSHRKSGWEHPLEKPAYDRGREIRESLGG